MKIGFFIGSGIAVPSIVRSSAKACQKLGHRVKLIPLQKDVQDIRPFIENFKPDIVIAIDHTGINDKQLEELKIPYCSWFVDNPLYFVDKNNFNPYHIAAVSDISFMDFLEKMGCKKIIYCPLAFDPDFFYPDEVPQASKRDLCYVGSFPGSEEKISSDRRKKSSDILNSIIDSTIKINKKEPNLSIQESLTKTESSLNKEFINQINFSDLGGIHHLIDTELDSYNKTQVCTFLKDYSFEVYGNALWKEVIKNENQYKGEIKYHKLRELYSSTKINIIISRPQMHRGLNQRFFDIPATGSFFLSDYKPILNEFFPNIAEQIIYKNITELKEKVNFYLNNENIVSDLKTTLYNCIKKHSYVSRMEHLLSNW